MRSIFEKAEPEFTLAYFKKEADKALQYERKLLRGRGGRELSKQRYELAQHVAGLIAGIDEDEEKNTPLNVLNLLGQAILHNRQLTADHNAKPFAEAQGKGKDEIPKFAFAGFGELDKNLTNTYEELVKVYNKHNTKQPATALQTLISNPGRYMESLTEDRTRSKQTVDIEELVRQEDEELKRHRPSRTDTALEDEAERAVNEKESHTFGRRGSGSR